MGHGTLVSGVQRLVTAGLDLVDGVQRKQKKGLTLVGGVQREIAFSKKVPISNFGVGDSVYINVNGSPTEFLIVHRGRPSTLYDTSCDGTWLLMKDIYEKQFWNSGGTKDYKSSTIHSYLNSTFLNLIDSDIRAQIKTVKIPYVSVTGSTGSVMSGSSGLSAQVFFLSAPEVGYWGGVLTNYQDGACLSYFDGYDLFNNERRTAYFNGTDTYWWTRSPTNTQNQTVFVASKSMRNGVVDVHQYGVRPAFIVPNDCMIDEVA